MQAEAEETGRNVNHRGLCRSCEHWFHFWVYCNGNVKPFNFFKQLSNMIGGEVHNYSRWSRETWTWGSCLSGYWDEERHYDLTDWDVWWRREMDRFESHFRDKLDSKILSMWHKGERNIEDDFRVPGMPLFWSKKLYKRTRFRKCWKRIIHECNFGYSFSLLWG